ncbi:hypothetical protein scyTo_0015114 [Scyliorhinus torazame]|uniref:Uncharacterized protein n=1 Tax=Scyliorhinus torazame TaxID=75743 RepID=A0A401P2I0_SCYTO|nr:hypothetical protein [Scyliorhinus torazame]
MCLRQNVKRKSQRTFKRLIDSPTQIPYFLCILIYWGLLLVAPLYSIESPHVMHSYTGIEEGAERLIRVRKAVILQELREKLANQMAKIQASTY